jgi:hypothetical protein
LCRLLIPSGVSEGLDLPESDGSAAAGSKGPLPEELELLPMLVNTPGK